PPAGRVVGEDVVQQVDVVGGRVDVGDQPHDRPVVLVDQLDGVPAHDLEVPRLWASATADANSGGRSNPGGRPGPGASAAAGSARATAAASSASDAPADSAIRR